MKTRRHFLASAATTAAMAPLAVKAATRHFGEPRVLTTLKIVNTSRSEVPAGAVTQLIGCPFKKGDIPAGSWPQFQLPDGTPVAATILDSLATTWSDRSLKFVPVMLQIPVAIDAHVRVNVRVLSDGALPQGSPRRLGDFKNGISPQVQVDGLDNLRGTWVMELAEGIAEGKKVVTYGNGPAGGVWKVRARARQGDKHHHQLVCDFYIAALSNLDGSLKGLRILGKVKLPYYDTKEAMNWMSFSRFQLCANRSGPVIRDCFGENFGDQRAYHFEWVSGSSFAANHRYSIASYGDYGYCTRLSSTGQLPTGLFSNVSYFTGNPTASTIGFGTNSRAPFSSLVSATDNGVGKHTATPYPYLAYFGALFTAGPMGMWDYVQGAGSDQADVPLRAEIDRRYWVSTHLIPSYDIKVQADSNKGTSYWPNCSEPVCRALGNTGERDDLGIMPAWYARHFLTQRAIDERVVRVASLIAGQFSIGLESVQTRSLLCVNNGADNNGKPYSGMPAPNPKLYWNPGSATQGFPYGDTTNPNVLIAGFTSQTSDHMPQFNYYPYLFTGEPWHLDMLLEHANNAVGSRYAVLAVADIGEDSYSIPGGRNLQVPPSAPTYGNGVGANEVRATAWGSALIAAGAGICPEVHPDCRSYKKYFNDLNADTWTAALRIYKALPNYASKYGLWHVMTGPWAYLDHWQMAYLGAAVSLAIGVTENNQAHTALNGLVQWFNHVYDRFGGWHIGAYMTTIKSGAEQNSPIVKNDDGVAFNGPVFNWQAGGHFTLVPFSNYAPANGDKVIFADSMGGLGQVTPAGFAKYTPYYIVNLDGNQFDLSHRPGGLAIGLTDSYDGSDRFFIVATNAPATGNIAGIGYPTSYPNIILGMLNYALATGAGVGKDVLSDLAYRNQLAGNDYRTDPKWAMKASFV